MSKWKYHIGDISFSPLENEYFDWAREQFGDINQTRWNANFQGFWFNLPEDVTLFVIRWGDHPNLANVVTIE